MAKTVEVEQDAATLGQTIGSAITEALDRNARKVDKNNPDYPYVSVYRPKGLLHEDYADLKFHRQPYFNHGKVLIDTLMPAEVEAYNALSRTLKGPGDKRTARNGRWKAEVSANNDGLMLNIPCKTEEDRTEVNAVPGLEFLLRELTLGAEAANPASILDELRKAQAEIEKLKARG